MAAEPTYRIYPVIRLRRIQDNFESDNNFAGSLGTVNEGTYGVTSRKGAFLIGFTEAYNNPSTTNQIAFTMDPVLQSTTIYRKRQINIFLAQHQYSNIGSSDGYNLFGYARALTTRYYNITGIAYGSGGGSFYTRTEELSNSTSNYSITSTHYYPLDFTNCLTYSNTTFNFSIKPLLDNNGSVINNNTLFKGYYILC